MHTGWGGPLRRRKDKLPTSTGWLSPVGPACVFSFASGRKLGVWAAGRPQAGPRGSGLGRGSRTDVRSESRLPKLEQDAFIGVLLVCAARDGVLRYTGFAHTSIDHYMVVWDWTS